MAITQIRTTNIQESIDFYVNKLGFKLDFRYQDFYAGIESGSGKFHLKLVDKQDPSIDFVRQGNHLHLYFPITNACKKANDLKSKGVVLITEPHNTNYSKNEPTDHRYGYVEKIGQFCFRCAYFGTEGQQLIS